MRQQAPNEPLRMALEAVEASPLVAVYDEPPPHLVVDAPLPTPLELGKVFIPFRTQNMRVLPVYGPAALDVSPRVGHLHVTVDGAAWHFVHSSTDTLVIVGLAPGDHSVLVELADPIHRVVASQLVAFSIPRKGLD